ncbi:hypothetical protein BT93_J1814 [Corymbia citriodora subsp. variegata]|nr:hypothetical protein BT93_J1814 [Corymbia citriodora subsp. variegata]
MFPSMMTNNIPQHLLPPSLPNASSPTNQEIINQAILFHHQMPFTDHHLFFPNNHIFPVITEAPIDMGSPKNGGKVSSSDPANKPMKKDRHRKIYTAQGLRDRRVRLSIEISRRFFDLQDMLGFDKASKTLEWLLTKSRKAIKDLAKAKAKRKDSALGSGDDEKGWSCSTSECDQAVSTGAVITGNGMVPMDDKRSVLMGYNDHRGMFKMVSSNRDGGLHVLAKESRAKARARARARTRAKMCDNNTRLDHHDQSKKLCPDSQASSEDKKSNHHVQEQADHQAFSDHQEEVDVEQSVLINRKLKQCSVIINNYQKSLEIVGKDVICEDNNSHFCNYDVPHQNWDINPAIARSTFSSVTNMNFSSGVLVCGKQWDSPNSHSLQ